MKKDQRVYPRQIRLGISVCLGLPDRILSKSELSCHKICSPGPSWACTPILKEWEQRKSSSPWGLSNIGAELYLIVPFDGWAWLAPKTYPSWLRDTFSSELWNWYGPIQLSRQSTDTVVLDRIQGVFRRGRCKCSRGFSTTPSTPATIFTLLANWWSRQYFGTAHIWQY